MLVLFDELADLGPARLRLRLFFALLVERRVLRGLGLGLLLQFGLALFLAEVAVFLADLLAVGESLPLLALLGLLDLFFADQAGLQQLLSQRQAAHAG